MTTHKNSSVLLGIQARSKMMEGVNLLANAVKTTLGPRGRNVAIKNPWGGPPRMTKDGVTVANHIEDTDDSDINIGIQIVREAAAKTAKLAGDGTTTATVLAQKFIQEGYKLLTAGYSPIDLGRGMKAAEGRVVDLLRSRSLSIENDEQILSVGTLACNGDKHIGALLVEAVQNVGQDGVITLAHSDFPKSHLEIIRGCQISKGWSSVYFMNQPNETCLLENPYILIWNEKIPVFKPFANLVSAVKDTGRSLLIICDEIDGEGLAMLIANRHAVKTCPVNAPYSGEKRTELLKDIAAITGARYLSMASGIKPEKITLDMLGQADRCVIDEISTLIVNGQGNPEECQVRAQQVRDSIEKCQDASTREYLDKRLGSLDTGIASLRVGAPTEVERLELYDRVEDAINAVKAAFKEGISPGGGFALLKAAQTLEANRESIFKQEAPLDHSRAGWIAGFDIVLAGIEQPCFQILINAGFDPSEKLFSYYMCEAEVNYSSFGFDSSTGNEVNLLLEGIIDPTFVITTALKDAISVSSMIMTTEAIVGTGKMPDRSSLMNGLPGMGM